MEVYAACGVPAALFTTGEGTAPRESFRRLLHSTVQPLGRIVAAELSAKLDADVSLSFDALFAADLSGRARASSRSSTVASGRRWSPPPPKSCGPRVGVPVR